MYKRQGIVKYFVDNNLYLTEHAFYCNCKKATIDDLSITTCLLYTSDAADERSSVDLGGRRIIKKKKKLEYVD